MSEPANMFEEEADKIFAEVGLSKETAQGWWDGCVNILSNKMATLSANQAMGLCDWEERVKCYREQRDSLVEDLRGFIGQAGL